MPDTYAGGNDAALISGAAQVAGSAINAFSVAQSSKKDRAYMDKVYAKTRADALADRDFANQYNLPTSQMQRLKAAGLNPNLIYGKAGADMSSQPVRAGQYISYHRDAPQVGDAAGAIGNYFQVASQQTQLANMQAQRALIDAQTQKTLADTEAVKKQTPGYEAESGIKAVNLDVAKATKEARIAIENGNVNEQLVRVNKMYTETQIETLKALPSVELMVTEAAKLRSDMEVNQAKKAEINTLVDNLKRTGELQQFDIEFIKRSGNTLRPGASPMWTIAASVIDRLFPNKEDAPHKSFPQMQPDDSLLDYFNNMHKKEMQKADWKKYTK